MPSQFDTVLLEIDTEDARRVVMALRNMTARYVSFSEPDLHDQLDTIANYIEVQINAAERLAEQRPLIPTYMGFDRANDVTCFDPVAEAEARQP